jgi:hypothetical protein
MKTLVEKRLSKFLFPIGERKVYIEDSIKMKLLKTGEYKAIFREDKNKLISIMKDTYKIVPNIDVIMPLLEELHKLDTRWIIDESHSFVENNRMRLQVTFPELTLNDGRSDIALSLFLHNSYDGSEGVRMYFGSIRKICGNGMVWGQVLTRYYHRHTHGIELKNLKEEVSRTYESIPVIKERIEVLKRLETNDIFLGQVEEKLGKGISKYVAEEHPAPLSQWALYNLLTYYISHVVKQHMRAHYQFQVSRLFKL